MFETIVKTVFSKIVLLFINLFLVIYTAHLWGSAGRGQIALFMADLALVSIVIDIVAGSSLAYYSSRHRLRHLLPHVYAWSLGASVMVPLALHFYRPQENLYLLMFVSLALALMSSSAQVFVGRQLMGRYNFQQTIQPAMLMFLAVSFSSFHPHVDAYFYALFASYIILFVLSLWQMRHTIEPETVDAGNVLHQLLTYGSMSQLSVFMQFLNYRLTYYFLAAIQNVKSVGVFSVGVALSEALWIICRSISVVLFSRNVHNTDHAKMEEDAKFAMKLSLYASLVASIAVLLIPEGVYSHVFGKDFTQTKTVLCYLLPGILAISASDIAGHYFAAQRQLIILNIKSVVGLALTILLSVLLIPRYGIAGACISMSASYLASSLVLLIAFAKQVPVCGTDLLISRKDWERVGEIQLFAKR